MRDPEQAGSPKGVVHRRVAKSHDPPVQPVQHEKDPHLAQAFRQPTDVDHARRAKELVIGTFGRGAKQWKTGQLTQTRQQRIIGPTVIAVAPFRNAYNIAQIGRIAHKLLIGFPDDGETATFLFWPQSWNHRAHRIAESVRRQADRMLVPPVDCERCKSDGLVRE